MLEVLSFVESCAQLYPMSKRLAALADECARCIELGVVNDLEWFAREAHYLVSKQYRPDGL